MDMTLLGQDVTTAYITRLISGVNKYHADCHKQWRTVKYNKDTAACSSSHYSVLCSHKQNSYYLKYTIWKRKFIRIHWNFRPTLQSRVLEKLLVPQLVEKFLIFHGTWTLTAMFTKTSHFILLPSGLPTKNLYISFLPRIRATSWISHCM
jgi:hypothetical protein